MTDPRRPPRALIGSPLVPVALILFAGVPAVISAGSGAVRAQDDSSGAALYATNCAGCHQAAGEGLPGTFPPLAANPTATDPEYVATVITEGKSGPMEALGISYDAVMPPFADLTPAEVAAITDHVVALASGAATGSTSDAAPDSAPGEPTATTQPPAAPTVGDPDRGRDLYVGSDALAAGGTACASCHAAGDVGMMGGSGLGPDLTGVYGRLGGEPGLTAWLANPASPTMMPIFADHPLTDAETADLVAFLADAPDRETDSDTVDWLLIAGLIGVAALLGAMAIAFRGRRRPYAHTLAAKAATTTATTTGSLR